MEFFVKTVKIAEIRLLFWQKTIVDIWMDSEDASD